MFKSFNLPLMMFNFQGNTYIKEGKHCPIVNERKYQTMQVLGENVG
jgi:hypothetical protein